MAFYGGYDTDDLTQRQYHYFCKLSGDKRGGTVDAISFLKYCVARNYSRRQCDNYDEDCVWLFSHPQAAERAGIDLNEVYK